MALDDVLLLKEEFPIETRGFTIVEINEIWKNYSESLAACWIIPNSHNVEYVFNRFKYNND